MYNDDCFLPKYSIPNLRSFIRKSNATASELAEIKEGVLKDPDLAAKDILSLRNYHSWMNKEYQEVGRMQRKDNQMACVGNKLHSKLKEMMWDQLTLLARLTSGSGR